ncbi:hypothetical protein [Agrobacterium pusense]|uniref:hypothetical protein n=1 Tax=Agrobacterium pusense TaxID=648995 RepID=UPI003FD1CA26
MALWDTQSLQIAWFLASMEGVNVETIYSGLFGKEADSVQRSKVPTATNPFLGVASGAILSWQVVLQLQPGRLDLYVQPDPNNLSDVPPVINSDIVIGWMEQILREKSDSFPPAIRLAFICNFLKTAPDLESSRREIAKLIDLDERITSYSDLLFQLNRRCESGVPQIQLNRLLRWSTIVFQMLANATNMPVATEEKHASSLMVDVNTVINGQIFTKVEQVPIFNSMISQIRRLGEERTVLALME